MMNKLLRDLINTGKVAVFIDDVIVGLKIEEGHDELVAEVIKRLEENDLYVKPEKCKWKVREVEFLGVVIGPEGIKMERKKVKGVLEWPTRHVVDGMQRWMDHKNLEYFMKAQKLNKRQARWALYLSRFDFTLKHVAGAKMGKADGLSVMNQSSKS